MDGLSFPFASHHSSAMAVNFSISAASTVRSIGISDSLFINGLSLSSDVSCLRASVQMSMDTPLFKGNCPIIFKLIRVCWADL